MLFLQILFAVVCSFPMDINGGLNSPEVTRKLFDSSPSPTKFALNWENEDESEPVRKFQKNERSPKVTRNMFESSLSSTKVALNWESYWENEEESEPVRKFQKNDITSTSPSTPKNDLQHIGILISPTKEIQKSSVVGTLNSKIQSNPLPKYEEETRSILISEEEFNAIKRLANDFDLNEHSIGRYTIERFVSSGNIARVFKASSDSNPFALKIPNSISVQTSPSYIKILYNEFKIASMINSAYANKPIDFLLLVYNDYKIPIIVFEYVDGVNIRDLYKFAQFANLPADVKNQVLGKLSREFLIGIHEIHNVLKCHDDISGENVMVMFDSNHQEFHIKIIDFGTAKSWDDENMIDNFGDCRERDIFNVNVLLRSDFERPDLSYDS